MMRDPAKVLLGNLSISNLLCAVFVQLISAILDGYAISINNYRVINSHTTPNFQAFQSNGDLPVNQC